MPTFQEDLRLILSSLEEELASGRFGDAAPDLSYAVFRTRNRMKSLAALPAAWRTKAEENAAKGSITYDGTYVQSTMEAEDNGHADGKAAALKECAEALEKEVA